MDREDFLKLYNTYISSGNFINMEFCKNIVFRYCKDRGKNEKDINELMNNLNFIFLLDPMVTYIFNYYIEKFSISTISKDGKIIKAF